MLSLSEYTDKDMVKSLARAIELLTEENKELRQELREMREEFGYRASLTDEQMQTLKTFFGDESCE
jgi:predicted  nucleic acid-binding Zn-ribbon protein